MFELDLKRIIFSLSPAHRSLQEFRSKPLVVPMEKLWQSGRLLCHGSVYHLPIWLTLMFDRERTMTKSELGFKLSKG